ncbi:MAG: hypothetical protein N2117_15685 [Anaerolineales bacterium]|nr:hypothetical protein [Anaerolineales bacterium]MCX7756668.1 hypothetical protein [Anaerolineales bacterium]MDW8277257.1 hypothetical protein [Anaerolineales bacterium]
MPGKPPSHAPLVHRSACGDRIDAPWRYPIVMYKGRQVILCSVECLKQFQKDPDGFMSGEVIHINSNKRTQPCL